MTVAAFQGAWTRRPWLAALVLGVVSALGFQPLALWPLTLLGIAGLIALVRGAPDGKCAALLGWAFGVGQFTVGNFWIATTFTYQAALPVWAGAIAVFLLALYLAVFPALAALAAWHARRSMAGLVLAFAGAWIVTEWLRSWVFTGFPWNPLGVVLLGPFEFPGAARLLPWLGTYALSGLAVLFAGGWYAGLVLFRTRRAMLALLPLPIIAMFWPQGAAGDKRTGPAVPYSLIQPNIAQEVLNDPEHFEDNFRKAAQLSGQYLPGRKRLVLWPESGVPDYLEDGYPERYYLSNYGADPGVARQRIAGVIGPGSLLLTGTTDLEIAKGRAAGARNVVTALDDKGVIRASYAKAHLVPFGEYLPLRPLLEPLGLARFVPGDIDFWPGSGPRTLDLGAWGRVGPQVCYEIIFSGRVIDRADRPQFVFNPTNDGWFGAWGPPQHLAQARLRAIEEGLPVLRSTTTGISAVIDAHGVVRQSVPHNAAGRLDGVLPPALAPTPFAQVGNALALGWGAVLLGLSLVATRRRRD